MQEETTGRGFSRVNFTDRYGESCSLQDSSLATEDAIWLGVDANRMHLTREMVSALLPYLQRFIETGFIFGEDTDQEQQPQP